MSLKQNIDDQIKQAMRDKAQDRLRALRAIKSLILLEETKEGKKGDLTEEEEMKILNKAAKQRRESAEIFKAQNRADLYEIEAAELSIIEEFLPKQLTEEEIRTKISEIIARVGASAPSDMGKVMGPATKEMAGLADGKVVSAIVKELLAK